MRKLTIALALLLAAPLAGALEFRSVKESGVALYKEPTITAEKLFVVSRYYPVEVLSTQKEWARVRDASGGINWIPLAALSSERTLLVTAERATAYRQASSSAALAYQVPRDGVFELIGPAAPGWVSVRHRSGGAGFVRIGEVWGL